MSSKVQAHHFYFVRLPYTKLSAVKHHNVRCCWRYVHIVRFHCQDLIWYSIFLMQFEDGLMSAWLFLCFGMHAKMQMAWTSRSIRLKNNKNIPCTFIGSIVSMWLVPRNVKLSCNLKLHRRTKHSTRSIIWCH